MGKTEDILQAGVIMSKYSVLRDTALVFIVLCMFAAALAYAAEKKEDKSRLDYIAVAVRLCSDGHYDRAVKVLDNVDLSNEDIDFITYYTIRGMAEARLGHYQAAVDSFRKSVNHGQTDSSIYVYLSNLYFKLNQYENAIESINHAGSTLLSDPKLLLLKAECFWRLKRYPETFNTLEAASEIFPDEPVFVRQRFYYFLQLQLYRRAAEAAEHYLAKGTPSVDDYIAVANALMGTKQVDKAIIFLGRARLVYPYNKRVIVALANLYVKKRHFITAAGLFERLSFMNPGYAMDAAELYRRNQRYFHALYLNSRVPDQKAKIKQKLAILLDMKAFEMVVNMRLVLSRTGLLDDDNIRYAYAYALFFTGNYDQAEKYLKQISQREVFQKATGLREMIEKCRREPDQC